MRTVQDPSPHPATAAAWLVVAVVIAAGAAGGVVRGLADRPNWASLQREVTYVWRHRETAPGTAMFGYLPAASFALWPSMVWLPKPLGVAVHVATNVAVTAASLWILFRWWGPTSTGISIVWPTLLATANIIDVLGGNQLTLWALFGSVAGLTLTVRGRPWVGGMAVGLAGLIKTLPFLLVGYLLLRRQWRAVGGAAAAVVLFDLVPSIAFFGWHGAIDEHRKWLVRTEWHSSPRQIASPLPFDVRHRSNFSYAMVLTRWLRAVPDADELVLIAGPAPAEAVEATRVRLRPNQILAFSPIPPRDTPWCVRTFSLSSIPRFHVACLSAHAILWIWALSVAAAAAALTAVTWRAGPPRCRDDWMAGAALWLLATFWFTPMMRPYYLPLALPALVVVWRTMAAELHRNHDRWTPGAHLVAWAMITWLIGVICLGWDTGCWYGIHLGVVAVLTAATVWSWRCARNQGPPQPPG